MAPAVPVVISAPASGARVIVRDGAGAVAFSGDIAFGGSKSLSVSPPVRIQSSDGSVTVSVKGEDHGPLGTSGSPAPARSSSADPCSSPPPAGVGDRYRSATPARPSSTLPPSPPPLSSPLSPPLSPPPPPTRLGASHPETPNGVTQPGPGRPGIPASVTHPSYSKPYDHLRRTRDLGLRPQRGRLRGAGRAAGRGWVHPGRRPGRRGHRRGQHLRLRRAGQEGLRRHAARGADLKDAGRTRAVVAVGLPGRAVRRRPRREPARGRRGARVRRLPRHRRPAPAGSGRRAAPPALPRRTGASCCRSAPVERRQEAPTSHPRPRPGQPADPARQGPDRQPQARQRLRPALLLLRDPQLPRLLRQPPPDRGARRGALAGRPGCQGAVPGQRELHVLRQGPRRPPSPRDPPARPGRRSTASSGSASPTSSPPRPGPGWSRPSPARRASRRTSTSPSSTPAARCCGGCAASATPRASSACSSRSGPWRRTPGSAPT